MVIHRARERRHFLLIDMDWTPSSTPAGLDLCWCPRRVLKPPSMHARVNDVRPSLADANLEFAMKWRVETKRVGLRWRAVRGKRVRRVLEAVYTHDRHCAKQEAALLNPYRCTSTRSRRHKQGYTRLMGSREACDSPKSI